MSVLASVMTPATAKSAHKQNGASGDGSDAIDFAALLESAPAGTGPKAASAAKGKHGAKVELMPEGQAESLSAETSVADTELSKSRVKQAKQAKAALIAKDAKAAKAVRDAESAATAEAKTHMPSESASAVAHAVVPIATSHMERGEGEPAKGRTISSIASGKGAALVAATATKAASDAAAPVTPEAGAPADGSVSVAPEAGATAEKAAAVIEPTDANGARSDSATAQIKPGEATELLRQLSGAFEKKAGEKVQAEPAPQNVQAARGKNEEGASRPDVLRAAAGRPEAVRPEVRGPEAGRVEAVRSGEHGAEVTRTEAGRVEVVRPEVARSETARAETGRPEIVLGKPEAVVLPARTIEPGSKAAKSAEGTASVAAAETAPVAPAPAAQGEGKQSDRRDERGRDAKTLMPSSGAAPSTPVVAAASFSMPVAPGDAVAPQPGGAVATALGQQVIDMGVSGQWLDSISHQIATVAASNGQGSFSISPENLGGIRVDITQGDAGAQVHMTVNNEAARFALMQDSDRLLKDAQLSSVRIADIQVDMVAQVGDTKRSDMNQNEQSQQQSGQNASGWTSSANGNASGQGQRNAQFAASGQGAGSGSGGNQPKFGGNNAVSSEMKRADGGHATGAQRARYA